MRQCHWSRNRWFDRGAVATAGDCLHLRCAAAAPMLGSSAFRAHAVKDSSSADGYLKIRSDGWPS